MNIEDLQIPLTELETAELFEAAKDGLTSAGMARLRRLAFELHALRDKIARVEKERDELSVLVKQLCVDT